MKATALVASAREHGNCYEFAQFMAERLRKEGIETEIINFYDYRITPCQKCTYECVQKYDPEKRVNAHCPIEDDLTLIWEKVLSSDVLLIFVPTYGGLPPALWVAFIQRTQAFPTLPRVKSILCIVLASPHWSSTAELTPCIIADEMKHMGDIVGFEIINNAGYNTENLFGSLIKEAEIQRRLAFLVDRIVALRKQPNPKESNEEKF